MSDEVAGNWGLSHIKTSTELDLSAKLPTCVRRKFTNGECVMKVRFYSSEELPWLGVGERCGQTFEQHLKESCKIIGLVKYMLERNRPQRFIFAGSHVYEQRISGPGKAVICKKESRNLVNGRKLDGNQATRSTLASHSAFLNLW